MENLIIYEAVESDYKDVVILVANLLEELDPNEKIKIEKMNLVTKELLKESKIWVFLAKYQNEQIGIITLHECAAIYAGGLFGEISELYVSPKYRSKKIGKLLINKAIEKGIKKGWRRLEVGAPPINGNLRTINFYKKNGFKESGPRLRYIFSK